MEGGTSKVNSKLKLLVAFVFVMLIALAVIVQGVEAASSDICYQATHKGGSASVTTHICVESIHWEFNKGATIAVECLGQQNRLYVMPMDGKCGATGCDGTNLGTSIQYPLNEDTTSLHFACWGRDDDNGYYAWGWNDVKLEGLKQAPLSSPVPVSQQNANVQTVRETLNFLDSLIKMIVDFFNDIFGLASLGSSEGLKITQSSGGGNGKS